MPYLNTKSTKYRSGSAAEREQHRQAELDLQERNEKLPTIFVKGYGFRPYHTSRFNIGIRGPLCPKTISADKQCLAPLSGESIQAAKAHCDVCGTNYDLPYSFEIFAQIARKAFEGYQNSTAMIITLDIPYEAVKASSKSQNRKIEIVWSQKDGRNMAIIYFIENNDQGQKTQMFIDMDREEVRHDAADISPFGTLERVKAKFTNTTIEIKYK